MKNVLGNSCEEYQNTDFMYSDFFSEYRAFYDIVWKKIVEPSRSHNVAETLCMLDN